MNYYINLIMLISNIISFPDFPDSLDLPEFIFVYQYFDSLKYHN